MITKLGSVITEYSVRNKQDENIPVYSVTNERGFCNGYFSKDVASKDRTTYKIVPRGYFAYNPSRINVGSVDWQNCEDRVIVSPLYVVFGVDKRLDQQYLLHYLKSDITLTYIKALATGSVRDNLKYSVLQEFPINLRSIDEQRKIASILDRIDRIIELRKEEVETLNDLVKSRFIEMFGDPQKNTQNRPTTELINVIKMQRGFDLPTYNRNQNGDIPVYGANGALDRHDTAKVLGGGVITGRSGTIGNVYYTLGDYWPLNTSLFSSDLHGNNVIYLAYLLDLFDLTRFKEGTGVPTLNRNKFHKEQIIVVPITQQTEFAAFVEQTDKSKLAVQQGLQELEILKKSLMQQYFG